MTFLRAFATIVFCAIICALLGLIVGWIIGAAAPDYFRTVFGLGDGADPVSFGLAIGALQGGVAGIVIGLVAVIAVTWFAISQHRRAATT